MLERLGVGLWGPAQAFSLWSRIVLPQARGPQGPASLGAAPSFARAATGFLPSRGTLQCPVGRLETHVQWNPATSGLYYGAGTKPGSDSSAQSSGLSGRRQQRQS